MHRNLHLLSAVLVIGAGFGTAEGAVVTSTRFTTPSSDVILSDGNTAGVATGATPEATIEALADVGSLQDFASSSGPTNTYDFSDGGPDIKMTYSGAPGANAGNAISNDSFATSGASSSRVEGDGSGGDITLTIDFGTYDSNAGTFDSNVASVAAAAFTLQGGGDQWGELENVTAVFKTDAGAVLSTLVYSGTTSTSYYGYQSNAVNIGSIEVTFDFKDGGDGPLGLDDIATSQIAIPEPASLALMGLGGTLLLSRRRQS